MNLYEALGALREGHPDRRAAAIQVYEALLEEARKLPRIHGASEVTPEDLAGEQLARWMSAPPSVEPTVHGGYLKRCLENLSISLNRKHGRAQPYDPTTGREPSPRHIEDGPLEHERWAEFLPGATPETLLELIQARLERVVDAAAETSRQPDQLRAGWRQLVRLRIEQSVTMHELVDEVLEAEGETESDEATVTRARNRLFQQHRRVRQALEAAVSTLEQRGELTAEEATTTRTIYREILNAKPRTRSQNPNSGA